MSLYVITKEESRFISETLQECMMYSEDLESACEECLGILVSLEELEQREYEDTLKEEQQVDEYYREQEVEEEIPYG